MPCLKGGKTDSLVDKTDSPAGEKIEASNFGKSEPYKADGQYTPQNLQDLVAVVVEAERKGKKLKAVGSLYSFSKAYWSDDFIIDTSKLNKHLSQPTNSRVPFSRPGDETDTNVERFRSREHHKKAWLLDITEAAVRSTNPLLIHVEAGIKIKDLLSDLKLGDAEGLALPAMGAGGGQSLAGALSTGTHGSEINVQPLIDQVRAIHLVGPGGQEWWIERTNGFSDPQKLKSLPGWCPSTIVKQDDYFFYAALVSVGRLGVIYSLVLEVRPEYWLEEHRAKKPWSSVREQLKASIRSGYHSVGGVFNNALAGQDLHFFQVVLNPNNNEHCWVTERWITDKRKATGKDKGCFDPIVSFCKPAEFPPGVIVALVAAAGLAGPLVGGILAGIAVTSDTFGEVISKVLSVAAPLGLISKFNEVILDGEHKPETRRNVSYKILDQANYERNGCMEGDSAEFFFNAQGDRFLEFVEEVFKHAEAAGGIPGYVSLRFTRQSDALLAMERFPLTVAIEITSLRPWNANAEYYRKVEKSALAKGGIPHWGQKLEIGRSQAEGIYGKSLDVFRWIVAETEASGVAGTFSSNFTRVRGLDLETNLSLEDYRKHAIADPVSLSKVFEKAQRNLELSARPSSIRELSSLFHPSLRDNTTGELPAWGRAAQGANGHARVSLKLLRLRFS